MRLDRPRLFPLTAIVLVAASCGSLTQTREALPAPPSGDPGEFRGPLPDDGKDIGALDPDADASVFDGERIASTEREDVPSALRGDRHDPAFPEPLVDLERIRSGGPPPDGIPPLDEPSFQNAAAVTWLSASEPVVVLEIDGEAKAYPVQVMIWHEIVNDVLADRPVTVAYCPLCNSALAYDRRLGDRILDFGTSGELLHSSLVMYDRQTESLWTHFDATAVVGHLTGEKLTTYSVQMTSWEDFRTRYPDGLVLSRLTGTQREYGRNPYAGYDNNPEGRPFLFSGEYDARLDPKQRVIAVRAEDQPAVVLLTSEVFEAGVVPFSAHGRELIAVIDPGTSSPLSAEAVFLGFDQGAAKVFVDDLHGESIDLVRTDNGFFERYSGITFDVFGIATDGSGTRLTPVEHLDTFWFAIAAFEPDSVIVSSAAERDVDSAEDPAGEVDG